MTSQRRTGVLGGTFDPIHNGHLGAAEVARLALDLEQVLLVPSNVPPHRPGPVASAYHRFAMTAVAVQSRMDYLVSDMELAEAAPSYTSATLDRLRARGYSPTELYFVTGADAFAEIGAWYDYPAILDRAHFAVVARPGYDLNALRRQLPELEPRMVDVSPAPFAVTLNPLPEWTVASGPEAAAPARTSPSVFLIHAATPDVSSTEVRRRLAAGQSIAGLVPHEVELHIQRHQLYGPAPELRDDRSSHRNPAVHP